MSHVQDSQTLVGTGAYRVLEDFEVGDQGLSTANLERSIGADHVDAALSANMSETVTPWKCSVEGKSELESDESIGAGPGVGR